MKLYPPFAMKIWNVLPFQMMLQSIFTLAVAYALSGPCEILLLLPNANYPHVISAISLP